MQIEGKNKQAVKDFFVAMNNADGDAIEAAYADDGVVWTMGSTLISGKRQKAEIADLSNGILKAFPQGLRFEIIAMTAEGERVAVEAESKGEHVSGKIYQNSYHFLFVIRDAKVVMLKEYMDTEIITDILCGGQRP